MITLKEFKKELSENEEFIINETTFLKKITDSIYCLSKKHDGVFDHYGNVVTDNQFLENPTQAYRFLKNNGYIS